MQFLFNGGRSAVKTISAELTKCICYVALNNDDKNAEQYIP